MPSCDSCFSNFSTPQCERRQAAEFPHGTLWQLLGRNDSPIAAYYLWGGVRKIHGDNFQALAGIITGASGLGLENATSIHVIWAVWSPEKVLLALSWRLRGSYFLATILYGVVRLDHSKIFRAVLPGPQTAIALSDLILICNSNIMAPTEWLPSKKNFELQFATNNLSHFPLTELLLPKLQETMRSWEVRVVILTSVAGACCFDLDPQKLPCPKAEYHDAVEYAVSKAVDCLTCPPFAEKELFAEKSGVHYSERLGTCFQSE